VSAQDCSLLSTEVVGGFTGVTVGMYAEGQDSASFNYLDYTEW
jgi:alpha-N-arabinofuranosidase